MKGRGGRGLVGGGGLRGGRIHTRVLPCGEQLNKVKSTVERHCSTPEEAGSLMRAGQQLVLRNDIIIQAAIEAHSEM